MVIEQQIMFLLVLLWGREDRGGHLFLPVHPTLVSLGNQDVQADLDPPSDLELHRYLLAHQQHQGLPLTQEYLQNPAQQIFKDLYKGMHYYI